MPVYRDGQVYDGTGWKFLTPYGSTNRGRDEFIYHLPGPGQKWGPWLSHPNPAVPDGRDCGPGRLHVMNFISAEYAPDDWWIWYVQYRGVIGRSKEKTAVRELRLRRVPRLVFWRMIRLGWCQDTNLDRVNLREAEIYRANLRHSSLVEADLKGANLYQANLRRAILDGANMYGANLGQVDLFNASLKNANMIAADLQYANLEGADLLGADLRNAYLRHAILRDANLRDANLYNTDLRNADLTWAKLPRNWKDITIHD